jgi:phytol kinase
LTFWDWLDGLGWWRQQAVGVAAVVLWLGTVMLAALGLRRAWPRHREWSRKLVHIGTGAVVLIAWALRIDRAIAVPAAALITMAAAINHRVRVLPAIEDVGRASYGTVAYGAAITILLSLFWPHHPDAVAAGVLVMALGDGLAGLLGAAVPSPSWQIWGQRKSLIGTTTMGLVSGIVLLGLGITTGQGPDLAGGGWMAIALVATLLEQLALFGLDNLTVPIVTGLLWKLLTAQA